MFCFWGCIVFCWHNFMVFVKRKRKLWKMYLWKIWLKPLAAIWTSNMHGFLAGDRVTLPTHYLKIISFSDSAIYKDAIDWADIGEKNRNFTNNQLYFSYIIIHSYTVSLSYLKTLLFRYLFPNTSKFGKKIQLWTLKKDLLATPGLDTWFILNGTQYSY